MNKPEDYNKESLEGSFLNGFLSEDIWEGTVSSVCSSMWNDSLLAPEAFLCIHVAPTLRKKMVVWELKLRCWVELKNEVIPYPNGSLLDQV